MNPFTHNRKQLKEAEKHVQSITANPNIHSYKLMGNLWAHLDTLRCRMFLLTLHLLLIVFIRIGGLFFYVIFESYCSAGFNLGKLLRNDKVPIWIVFMSVAVVCPLQMCPPSAVNTDLMEPCHLGGAMNSL